MLKDKTDLTNGYLVMSSSAVSSCSMSKNTWTCGKKWTQLILIEWDKTALPN